MIKNCLQLSYIRYGLFLYGFVLIFTCLAQDVAVDHANSNGLAGQTEQPYQAVQAFATSLVDYGKAQLKGLVQTAQTSTAEGMRSVTTALLRSFFLSPVADVVGTHRKRGESDISILMKDSDVRAFLGDSVAAIKGAVLQQVQERAAGIIPAAKQFFADVIGRDVVVEPESSVPITVGPTQ